MTRSLQIGSASGPVNQTVAGLTVVGGTGNTVVGGYASAPSTLTVNTNSNGTYSGMLGGNTATQNNLNFALSGSGQLTLTGSNSYVGTTTVSGGTLAAGSPSAFGVNSALSISAGATALLGGNSLTIGSSRAVAPWRMQVPSPRSLRWARTIPAPSSRDRCKMEAAAAPSRSARRAAAR